MIDLRSFVFLSRKYLTNGSRTSLNSFNNGRRAVFTVQLRKISNKMNLKITSNRNSSETKTKSLRNYAVAAAVVTLGLSYAAVPLYRIFCKVTGYGGTIQTDSAGSKLRTLSRNTNRPFTVKFNTDLGANLAWEFKPQQNEIQVVPGETALAFFTATNPTDKPIVGVSTYNVLPFEVGPYFNKIQCFCFEEQMLNPHEQVDMPVFFYIDPEIVHDPRLQKLDEIVLSYTFFPAKEGLKLPSPGFLKNMFVSN